MFMNLLGVQYSQVCGRIIGYGIGSPNAFFSSTHSIDSPYVDGVSITYGNPRQHIWTFAGTWDDTQTNPTFICPCTNINVNSTISPVPSFVGDDYFCETGVPTGSNTINAIWDGDGCGPTSACCTFNNPPWFCKQLAQLTTDDFEVRICSDQETSNEDTPIELIEVYVKWTYNAMRGLLYCHWFGVFICIGLPTVTDLVCSFVVPLVSHRSHTVLYSCDHSFMTFVEPWVSKHICM